MTAFDHGTTIVLREVLDQRIWAVRPMLVVADTPDLIAVYLPAGTVWKRPVALDGTPLRMPAREWRLGDAVWAGSGVLWLHQPGRMSRVGLLRDDEGELTGWYGNLELPLARTPLGFDHLDLILDIVIERDRRSWRWKDEDELEVAVRSGLIEPSVVRDIRAEGKRIVNLAARRAGPFAKEWEQWRPPRAWGPAVLPEGWECTG